MRKLKEKCSKILGGLMLVAAMIMTIIPVYANSTQYSWYDYAQTPGTNIWYTNKTNNYETKNTSSSIGVRYAGASQSVGINIYAAIDGGVQNVTYKGPYYVSSGKIEYTYIKNLAYENNHYSYVSIRPVMTTTTSGGHTGTFKPDV